MKRITAIALLSVALAVLVSTEIWSRGKQEAATPGAAAVWKSDPNLNEPGVIPIAKKTVPLKIGLAQNPVIKDFKTNYQTQQLEKQGNFDLSFESYPSGKEFNQKLELMVMSGGADLPDVIMGSFTDIQALTYGQAGMVIPVNKYYQNSAYYIRDSLSTIDMDPFKFVTSADGNMYGLFALNMSLLNEHECRMFVYEPWLAKLGLKKPATTDELLQVLRAFRDKDPNGNGKKDEIAYAGFKDIIIGTRRTMADFLMTSFVYASSPDYLFADKGKVKSAYNTNEWREGLRYLNNLIKEGLLSPLSFTQDRVQFSAMVSANPHVVGTMNGTVADYLGAKDARRTEYYVLPPLAGPSGMKATTWSPSLPVITMLITKNCKNPEAAFRLGDLMCSREFSVMTRWGEKGVDWVVPAPDKKSMFGSLGYKALIDAITPWGIVQNKWWAQVGPYIRDYTYGAGMVDTGNPFDTQIKLAETLLSYKSTVNRDIAIPKLVYTASELAEVSEIAVNVTGYVNESFSRFIIGDRNVSDDKEWDNYIREFDKMKQGRMLEIAQRAYDRMYKPAK